MSPEPQIIVAEGRVAFRGGARRSDNPYRGKDFYQWQHGWLQEKRRASEEKAAPPPEPVEVSVEPTNKRHAALVAQFERAVAEHEFIGTIPLYSDDEDEQRRINAERRRLVSNLTKTRNNLLRELAREPKFTLDGPYKSDRYGRHEA